MSPGFSPLEYRWTAFGMRKAGRLGKNAKTKKVPKIETLGKLASVRLKNIPETSGIYLFSNQDTRVFVGQTDNLRHRVEKHMEISSSRGLPDWLWDTKKYPLEIGVATMPSITRGIRQALELSLVQKWHPLLNFPRKVA